MPGLFSNLFGKKQDSDMFDTNAQREKQIFEKIHQFSQGLVTIQDVISPEAIEVDFSEQKINSSFTRSFFVAGYPRSVLANWLSPLINFPATIDISMFIYPVDSADILERLKRKITEMEAELQSDLRAGKITNIDTEVKLEDAVSLREELAKGTYKFFQFGLYFTVYANSMEELDRISAALKSSLGSQLIIAKQATMQMNDGFKNTLPMGIDRFKINRNMDTTSLATTFPFTSSELSMETGIMYGINEHNDSLVIFDRFKMENANMVIFAKSGAGKSYTTKLEVIRQLMFGVDVIILDPEHEYEDLSKKMDGTYIDFSFNSPTKINPFDLSNLYEEGENELGQKILSLQGLLRLMLGEMTAEQESLMDKAIVAAYKAKGITPDPGTQTNEPPLMEDLYKALIGMEIPPALDIAARLEKYITGSFRGLFDQKSNIDLTNPLIIFSVKEIEEELRPIAMYVILDFIWTRVKRNFKKRILIVDEAWYFMKNADSASFLYSMAKRARKYYLGVTTISQDVEDFLHNDYGKAIVSNSSIQFLMKQSSVSIPPLVETFHLSQGERQLLLSVDVGEGIFFAGQNHVALRVIASPEEHRVITTNPEEVMKRQQQEALERDRLLLEASGANQATVAANQSNPELQNIYSMISNLTGQPAASAPTPQPASPAPAPAVSPVIPAGTPVANATSAAPSAPPASRVPADKIPDQPTTRPGANQPAGFIGHDEYSIDAYRPPAGA